jgi:molybdopterin-guanine dinucleotide biosynthesis protein A
VTAAGIVLAGGRSSRMGTPKAELEWHGSTLLQWVVALVAQGVGGPVVVVRAPGQELPPVPADVTIVDDPHEGLGPLQGLAVGLAAVADQAEVAYLSAVDVPFLEPAFIRHVVAALHDDHDMALPVAHGHRQPLAAAYRTTLAPLAAELLAAGARGFADLEARCRVRRLDEAELLDDAELARADPELESIVGLNTPIDYARARARDAP